MSIRHETAGRSTSSCLTLDYDGTTSTTNTYDGAQNRITTTVSGGGPTETATVNAGNQVTETVHSVDGTTTYAFDGAVNRTSKTLGAQTDTYTYDALNRVTSASVAGVATTMTYGALGRRVTYASGGTTTHYVYDHLGNPLVELDSLGAVQAVYVLDGAIDEPVAQVRGGAASYYHQDHLGSVWAITDGTESTVRTYTYGAYGEFGTETGTLANAYHYTGRQWDATLELYFYRARHMDPRQGQFTQRDPIRDAGGINSYAYVGNNPIARTDSQGTAPECGSGWSAPLIPESLTFCKCGPKGCGKGPNICWTVVFTPACVTHDACWGQCGAGDSKYRYRCDSALRTNIIKLCRETIPSIEIDLLSKCQAYASIAFKLVNGKAGNGPWKRAQKKACCGAKP